MCESVTFHVRVHIAFFWEPESAAIQEPFNLPAWNKPGEVISGEVSTVRVFLRKLLVFLKTEFNMGAKQRKTHMGPANNKTCSKRNTKPSSPASLHLTKDIFDVIQNYVYLPSVYSYSLCVYHSFVSELSLYAAMIGVCVLFLGVCHREVRRQQLTVRNTIHLGVIWVGEPVLQTWHLSSQI